MLKSYKKAETNEQAGTNDEKMESFLKRGYFEFSNVTR